MNALGYESNRVTMKSTNEGINLSNMHVTGSECTTAGNSRNNSSAALVENKRYGVDYMDGVSLDQVMLTKHRDIQRVHLMKIDVETYEVHVLNGAMHTLCNVVVERIVVEIEYLKPKHKLLKDCDFARLHNTLDKMGYTIMDNAEKQTYPTSVPLANMPGEAVLVLENTTQSPAERLRGSADNVCQPFDLGSVSRK
jgi:FkbM family methyltransferase